MGGELKIEIEELEHTQEGGPGMRALYAAAREADGDSPCVLLVHDVAGYDACLRASLQRLASAGYHVLAPDLFANADVQPAAGEQDALRAWGELADRPALRALEQAASWLGARGDKSSLAVLGLGMGGSLAFLMGCTSRQVAAVVSLCGSTLYPELSKNKPAQPLELFLNLDRPFLGIFAEHDASVPGGHHELLSERLVAGHKSHELQRYAGTKRGFLDALGANYDEASASAAWQRTLEFLRDSL